MDEDQRYINALRRDLNAAVKENKELKEENLLLYRTIAAVAGRDVMRELKAREPD